MSGIQQAALAFAPAAGGGGGTPAFVDFAISAGATGVTTRTITKTIGAGNLVVVGVKWEDTAATPTVADTAGNNYTALTQRNQVGQVYTQLFYKINAAAGVAAAITVTYGTTVSFTIAGAWEFSGGATTLEGEGFVVAGTGTTWATTGVLVTQAVTALVNVTGNYNGDAATPGTDYTEDSDNADGYGAHFQHRITAGIATYTGNGTFPANEVHASVFAAFK